MLLVKLAHYIMMPSGYSISTSVQSVFRSELSDSFNIVKTVYTYLSIFLPVCILYVRIFSSVFYRELAARP
jgi:hypothetical protein